VLSKIYLYIQKENYLTIGGTYFQYDEEIEKILTEIKNIYLSENFF
jgi:hypothetical protein